MQVIPAYLLSVNVKAALVVSPAMTSVTPYVMMSVNHGMDNVKLVLNVSLVILFVTLLAMLNVSLMSDDVRVV